MGLRQEIRKKHGFASRHEEAYLNLARTHAVLAAPIAALFREHELSEPTYNVLRILRGVHRHPEDGRRDLACGEIVARMVTRVPDVTRLLDRLERAGLVVRTRGADDRRVVRVGITEAGLDRVDGLDAPLAAVHAEALDHLTSDELDVLNRLLERARTPGAA